MLVIRAGTFRLQEAEMAFDHQFSQEKFAIRNSQFEI